MESQQLYSPLLAGHIRVLDIAAGEGNEDIQCSLQTVDLSKNPTFTALSYVWGAYAAQPQSIICNGMQFDVTINCHAALWHLRKQLGSFTIWIDAICIDQSNLQEKASQIPLMEDIYTEAQKVFIWVGPATETSDRIMQYLATYGVNHFEIKKIRLLPLIGLNRTAEFLRRLFGRSPDEPSHNLRNSVRRGYDPESDTVASVSFTMFLMLSTYFPIWHPFPLTRVPFLERLTRDQQSRWRCVLARRHSPNQPHEQHTKDRFYSQPYACVDELEEFLEQPYITRIWTYQELLLAADPVLVCGTSHLRWHDFACTVIFLSGVSRGNLAGLLQRWERIIFDRAKLHESNLAHCEWVIRNSISTYAVTTVIISVQIKFWFGLACLATGVGLLIAYARFRSNNLISGVLLLTIGAVMMIWFTLGRINGDALSSAANQPRVFKNSTEGLPFALIARTSTQPLDMAYGAYAVLRRRGATLSAPSYDRAISDVYHDLTVTMLRLTQSLDFLDLSALFPLDSSPSWVPDWRGVAINLQPIDTERQFLWRRTFDELDRDLREAVMAERQTTAWNVNDMTLTVQAHEVGQVKTIARLQPCANSSDDIAKATHNANLKTLQNISNAPIQRQAYLFFLINLSPSHSYSNMNDDLPAMWYQELCIDRDWNERPDWFREYQIWLCNFFEHWRICDVNLGTEDWVALVKYGEIGDRIVRTKTMLSPVVVRDVGDGNHVKIAGAFRALYHQYWWKAVDDWKPKDVVFEVFHIH